MDQPSAGAMLIAHPSLSTDERAWGLMREYLDRAATLWMALNDVDQPAGVIRTAFAEQATITMTQRTTGLGW